MEKIKVGILTMSDGRKYLHDEYEELNFEIPKGDCRCFKETNEFDVVEGARIINSNDCAKSEAKRLSEKGVEVTIFNYAIWCYPQFTAVAANFAPVHTFCFQTFIPLSVAWWECWLHQVL